MCALIAYVFGNCTAVEYVLLFLVNTRIFLRTGKRVLIHRDHDKINMFYIPVAKRGNSLRC